MDTSVSVTAVLFTKDIYCKELLESKPKIRPKYSEAVIWGNSRCFSIQETLPKVPLLGKVIIEKLRQNNGLFQRRASRIKIIFGNVVTG